MYSLKEDLVLDPFLGTGTTMRAAITSQRNSLGYEIDQEFFDLVKNNVMLTLPEFHNEILLNRIQTHREFIDKRKEKKGDDSIKYLNNHLHLPIMTRQETDMRFSLVRKILQINDGFCAIYEFLEP